MSSNALRSYYLQLVDAVNPHRVIIRRVRDTSRIVAEMRGAGYGEGDIRATVNRARVVWGLEEVDEF